MFWTRPCNERRSRNQGLIYLANTVKNTTRQCRTRMKWIPFFLGSLPLPRTQSSAKLFLFSFFQYHLWLVSFSFSSPPSPLAPVMPVESALGCHDGHIKY